MRAQPQPANRGGISGRSRSGGRLLALLRLGRPIFLLGGLVLHTLGVVIARSQGVPCDATAWFWSQLAVTAIQGMTHYSNDYFDLVSDQANATPTRWSGGSRILVEGILPRRSALHMALALAVVALMATGIIACCVGSGGWMPVLLLSALSLAWAYSAPPLRLHGRGLGEGIGALLVGMMTPLVGYYSQAAQLTQMPLLAVLPLGALQAAMLLCVAFPDAVSDAATGKRTLVVRLGGAGAARLHAILLALAYGSLPFLVAMGLPWLVAAAASLGLPVAGWHAWRLLGGAWRDPRAFESIPFWGIALLMGTTLLELLAFTRLIGP